MFDWLREELQGFAGILFPAACPLCHKTFPDKTSAPFCSSCASGIRPLPDACCSRCALPFPAADNSSHLCDLCSRSLPPYLFVHAAALYDDGLRKAIHRFKYEGGHYLDRPLATLLEPELGRIPSCDLIVPVPLHLQRLRERTYNQSLLLARELGRLISRPVVVPLLERRRDTPRQQGLRANERTMNLKGAFVCRQSLNGEQVLLVDDVMTTGATVAACSQILLEAGAAAVRVAVIGRAGRG